MTTPIFNVDESFGELLRDRPVLLAVAELRVGNVPTGATVSTPPISVNAMTMSPSATTRLKPDHRVPAPAGRDESLSSTRRAEGSIPSPYQAPAAASFEKDGFQVMRSTIQRQLRRALGPTLVSVHGATAVDALPADDFGGLAGGKVARRAAAMPGYRHRSDEQRRLHRLRRSRRHGFGRIYTAPLEQTGYDLDDDYHVTDEARQHQLPKNIAVNNGDDILYLDSTVQD